MTQKEILEGFLFVSFAFFRGHGFLPYRYEEMWRDQENASPRIQAGCDGFKVC
jgi:hypothetical protein